MNSFIEEAGEEIELTHPDCKVIFKMMLMYPFRLTEKESDRS